jgi:hypothetical protein
MNRLAALTLALALAAPAHAAQSRAFVLATDFATGNVADVAFGAPPAATCNVAPTCADAVLRHHQGVLYVVERFGCDNIRVLDPNAGFGVVRQFSVGNGANPNDIAIVSPTRAFVTRYETAELWIVDPKAGTFVGSVSLAPFADADGIPEMNRMAVRNGRVFVTLQRVDRDNGFTPTDSSQVVVLDATTNALVDCDPVAPGVQGILLPFQNPTTEIVVDGAGRLVVGCTGAYGALDGGIARIDPVGLTAEAAEVTEATLGGDVVDVAVASAARGFAIVGDASFNTKCVPWDRNAGTAGAPVHVTAGFHLSDAEVNDRGELWLADRTPTAPGLRIFDAATLAPLFGGGPVSTCLPPQDLEFDGSTAVAVGPLADRRRDGPALAFDGAWPNPSRGAVSLRLALAPGFEGGPLRVTLVDPSGRRVRVLETNAPRGGGAWMLAWDGRDEAGRAVAPGVYGVRIAGAGAIVTGRVVRLPATRL